MARIGVNALYLIPGGVGGTEIYLRELLSALARIDAANEYFIFTNLETGADLTPSQANFHSKPQAVHARFRPARIAWEQTILPLEASRYKLDVLFSPGFTAPLYCACPCVTVFHDLQHKRYPEHFRWFDLPFWRLLLWGSAHGSRRLIAVSEATRADLERFYRLPSGGIRVVPHGVDEKLFSLKPGTGEPILLCVSTLHPHKNLDRLIRAYSRKRRDFPLIIAGLRGFHAQALYDLIVSLNAGDRVKLTGWIPREDLYGLYGRAHACIYPTTFEGFGMPVLEAMAAGVPVACSNIAPLREVAGDTALFFDPLDEDAIAEAIDSITTNQELRERLKTGARARALAYTWERTARETLDAILTEP